MHQVKRLCLAVVAASALLASVVRAEIVSTSFKRVDSLDLTAAGTIDWAVFGHGAGEDSLDAVDCKRAGAGIGRKLAVAGLSKDYGGDGCEGSMWTGVAWGWRDGSRRARLVHHSGQSSGTGMRVSIASGGKIAFKFAGAGEGETRQASLILRRDNPIVIIAVQGDAEKTVDVNGGKTLGTAIVRYSGSAPLTIELRSTGKKGVVRGFAAALGEPSYKVATLHDAAVRQADKLGKIDFLKAATDFADCMIEYGRDRYGQVHSPLFSNILTRQEKPRTTPYPRFARLAKNRQAGWDKKLREWTGPKCGYYYFHKFDFNKVLNYPKGLGGEGPHKVTLYGCDPYEDRQLYYMLIDLTRITGQPRYKAEALKALKWWFANTQGPSGLYPWGEHLGWDLVNDCPTYFAGESKHLYAACYHEIKDTVPFLEVMTEAQLTKYAVGIWESHFWDKTRAIYCRHGDYQGKDDRKGSLLGFPAHLGAYMRVWTAAYLRTKDPAVRKRMGGMLNTVLDAQIARAKKYGFVPFTFEADVKGKSPGKSAPGQSIRLAHHAMELSSVMRTADAPIADKMVTLAKLHGVDAKTMKHSAKPKPEFRDLSKNNTPRAAAREIARCVKLYRRHKDKAYLEIARKQGRVAYVRFMDDTCPLPKAYSGGLRKTAEGKDFPDFYFRGAELMSAFALLGEALKPRPTSNPPTGQAGVQ